MIYGDKKIIQKPLLVYWSWILWTRVQISYFHSHYEKADLQFSNWFFLFGTSVWSGKISFTLLSIWSSSHVYCFSVPPMFTLEAKRVHAFKDTVLSKLRCILLLSIWHLCVSFYKCSWIILLNQSLLLLIEQIPERSKQLHSVYCFYVYLNYNNSIGCIS